MRIRQVLDSLRRREDTYKPEKDPTVIPRLDEAEVQALRAVFDGRATSDQQTRFAAALVYKLAATYDMSFRGNNELTNFAEGRRSVGLSLVFYLKAAPTKTDPDDISARHAGDTNEQGTSQ